MKEDSLDFVRRRLEEGEGIAPVALERLLAAARAEKPAQARRLVGRVWNLRATSAALLAATLALSCCGWLVNCRNVSRREAAVANVIALLQSADGAEPDEGSTLVEALVAWQDAPCEGWRE